MVCEKSDYVWSGAVWSLNISRAIWSQSVGDCAAFMNEYFRNSLVRESPEMDRIRSAVREAGVFIVLGYSERFNGSIYIAQVSGLYHSHLR